MCCDSQFGLRCFRFFFFDRIKTYFDQAGHCRYSHLPSFLPIESTKTMSDSIKSTADEITEAYRQYLRAFMSDDIDTINSLVSYPLAYIGDGMVSMYETYPVQPSELRKRTGWCDTVNVRYKVVGISETKAHLILESGTRVQKDGSPIEDIYAFYAWTKTREGWKMYAVSDVCNRLK